jgi:hypothetical protein
MGLKERGSATAVYDVDRRTDEKVVGQAVRGFTETISDTDGHEVIAAPIGGRRLHITQVLVTNADSDDGTWVNILSGGNVIYTGYAKSAGGGFACTFPVESPLVLGEERSLTVSCETAAEVRVSASGYAA